MEDLESLVLRPVEYPPPTKIGPSHGGPRKFGFEASRIPPTKIGPSHGGPRKFGFEVSVELLVNKPLLNGTGMCCRSFE